MAEGDAVTLQKADPQPLKFFGLHTRGRGHFKTWDPQVSFGDKVEDLLCYKKRLQAKYCGAEGSATT